MNAFPVAGVAHWLLWDLIILYSWRLSGFHSPVGMRSPTNRISLLTDFEDADSYLDWSIGTHGISISFPHPSTLPVSTSSSSSPSPLSSAASLLSTASRRLTNSSSSSTNSSGRAYKPAFSATYLPEIAPEQGWDKIETVDSAIRKAGWSGRITEDLRRSVRVRRYQSRKCVRSWEEYVEWRKGSGGRMVGEGEEVDE